MFVYNANKGHRWIIETNVNHAHRNAQHVQVKHVQHVSKGLHFPMENVVNVMTKDVYNV